MCAHQIFSPHDALAPLSGREIIFEFIPIGSAVRVSVMDVASLTEVVISCPRTLPQSTMEYNGCKRLLYVLKKKGLI